MPLEFANGFIQSSKEKHSTPKYGLIYHASSIGKASQKHNGKTLGLYLQKLLLLSDRMPLVLMRTTPLALRVDSRLRHSFKFLKVVTVGLESTLVGEDLNDRAFVYGFLSFLDKISCVIVLFVLELYEDTNEM